MSLRTVRNNLLFWKIAGVFTFLLIALGITYMGVAAWMSKRNFNAINEQLYGDVAAHLARSTNPLKNGKPDTAVTHDIIHSTMLINPSVEIYLLDTTGRIIDFVVPGKTVKLPRIDLGPINEYIRDSGKKYITGDNPRDPSKKSIFSAAYILEGGKPTGYVYAILASEKQAAVAAALNSDFFFGLGTIVFFVTLGVAFLVGTITFFLMTDSVGKISRVVKRFKDGDTNARIEGSLKGNLGALSIAFNEMADTIVDNMNKLASVDKLRQELLANVSHDLRSPLAITQGYVETLIIKRESLSEGERGRYLAIIMSSLEKLGHLVQQLFEYSKLEANQVQPNKELFLLNDLVSDILMKYDIIGKERGISLTMECREDLPAVFADLALVERAIQNLLDNAIKFTPRNGTISVALRSQSKGVEVSVSDSGVGIPIHDQPFIFERYKKFQPLSLRDSDGAGLGLAIVKKIMDLHHATINIKSTPGAGTVFWFQLPSIPSN